MTKISRNLTENSSETVKSETERPKERYIYIYIYISRKRAESYWLSKTN